MSRSIFTVDCRDCAFCKERMIVYSASDQLYRLFHYSTRRYACGPCLETRPEIVARLPGFQAECYARWKSAQAGATIPAVTKPTGRPRGRPPSEEGPRKHVAIFVPRPRVEELERAAAAAESSVSEWVVALVIRKLDRIAAEKRAEGGGPS